MKGTSAVQAHIGMFSPTSVLEVAHLNVKPGQSDAFEDAFAEARRIIAAMPGHRWHQLQR